MLFLFPEDHTVGILWNEPFQILFFTVCKMHLAPASLSSFRAN